MSRVAQTTDPPTGALGRWQQAAAMIGNPYSVDQWVTALRESTDWTGLVLAVGHDIRAKEAALIAVVRLEDEREMGNGY